MRLSSDAIGHVWRYSPYRGSALAVHLAIADSANDQNSNEIWMSMAKLALKARVERRTAGRTVDRLVQEGWLRVLEERVGQTTRYEFVFAGSDVVFESRGKRDDPGSADPGHGNPGSTDPGCGDPGGGSLEPGGVGPGDPGGGSVRPTNPRRTQEITQADQTPLSPAAAVDPLATDPLRGFQEFWDIYPARNGKKLRQGFCADKWRLLNLADRRAAWRGARNYRAACDAGLQGAMDPERFLAAQRWNDWQEPATPGPGLRQGRPDPLDPVREAMARDPRMRTANTPAEVADRLDAIQAQTREL
jgi:hypothetical protein